MAFKKAICFGDIHWGSKNNDTVFNQDCADFITWIISEKERVGADTCIFLGDWHTNRHSIHVSTMNYSLDNMERLSKAFDKFYFILGNHDLYYREKRNLTSVAFGRNLDNLILINEPQVIDDVAFIPWLVGEEWKKMKDLKAKYIFGHFELPGYMMNAMVEMPDHGTLNASAFTTPEYVFSGHFHKRQAKDKVVYIGNPFPHNFADTWDDDRGYMLMEMGGEPSFHCWEDAPRYRTLKLSDLLESPEKYINQKTYARVTVDIEINFEEAQFIKETFQSQFNARRIDFIHQTKAEDDFVFSEETTFQTVDQIVYSGINEVESPQIDKKLLLTIYEGLKSQ